MKFTVASLLLILLLLSGSAGNLFAQDSNQDAEVIRVDTDLTNLFFTATNRQKAFITTLREQDLRVMEDGVPQKILTFQRETDRPLSIAFLIDVSISEERTLPQEKAAARTFIERVIQSSKDQAAIIPFTGAAYLEQGLTRDVFSIYRALERTEVALPAYLGAGRPISGIASGPGMKAPGDEGSTAIWDAIALTSSEVLARSSDPKVAGQAQGRQGLGSTQSQKNFVPNQRRRAIILLTDGRDSTSRLSRSEAINRALDAETVIYVIGIGDKKYGGVDRD
jgi:VWFA-related protein